MVDHLYRCKVKFEVLSKDKVGAYWHVGFARKCYATYEMLQKYLEGPPRRLISAVLSLQMKHVFLSVKGDIPPG